jgi:hypothetical protein
MSSEQCNLARRSWSEEFDGGPPVPGATAAHMHQCAACREFQQRALLLREQFSTVPLPPTSPARDAELLALLRPEAGEVRRPFWAVWQDGFHATNTRVLGTAGFAAFVVTLVTAQLLTTLPVEHGPRVVPWGATARSVDRPPNPDSVERWLASPQPRLLPMHSPLQVPQELVPEPTGPADQRRRGSIFTNSIGRLS